jgi:hypothetical protein
MTEHRRRHRKKRSYLEAICVTAIVLFVGAAGFWWILSLGYERPKGAIEIPRVELPPTAFPPDAPPPAAP